MTRTNRTRPRSGALAIGAAVAFTLAASGAVAQDKVYQWGSSSLGSTGHVIITTLAATVDKYTDLKNSARSTAGGVQNLSLIGEDKLDFGQAPSTSWPAALKGEAPHKAPVKAMQMFCYTSWPMPPLVRADSPIKSLSDIAGKRVMAGAAGGATANDYKLLMDSAGLNVNWNYGSWQETFNALKTGAVDVIPALMTSGRPAPGMAELEASVKVRPISVPADVVKKMRAANPGVLVGTIDPKDWPSGAIDKPIEAILQAGILAVHPSIPEDVAYKVTKAVFDNAEEVRSKGVQLLDISKDFASKYLIPEYPLHPGAARYFKEANIKIPDGQKIGM
jgi:TRAP transporter TAXI family solute receptor